MAITRTKQWLHSLQALWSLEGKSEQSEIDRTLANRYRLIDMTLTFGGALFFAALMVASLVVMFR